MPPTTPSLPLAAPCAPTTHSTHHTHQAPLDDCLICIFLLSPSFFSCQRSLSLMRRAVAQGKQCILINMPGGVYRPTQPNHTAAKTSDDAKLIEGTFTFPENSFNPAWQPFCPDVKPAFGEICIQP